MSNQSEIESPMIGIFSNIESPSDSELNFAFKPGIRKFSVKEFNLDEKYRYRFTRSFINVDDAVEYLFDLNLRKHIPVPIGFDRYHHLLEMTFVSSSTIEGNAEIITKIAEKIIENFDNNFNSP